MTILLRLIPRHGNRCAVFHRMDEVEKSPPAPSPNHILEAGFTALMVNEDRTIAQIGLAVSCSDSLRVASLNPQTTVDIVSVSLSCCRFCSVFSEANRTFLPKSHETASATGKQMAV